MFEGGSSISEIAPRKNQQQGKAAPDARREDPQALPGGGLVDPLADPLVDPLQASTLGAPVVQFDQPNPPPSGPAKGTTPGKGATAGKGGTTKGAGAKKGSKDGVKAAVDTPGNKYEFNWEKKFGGRSLSGSQKHSISLRFSFQKNNAQLANVRGKTAGGVLSAGAALGEHKTTLKRSGGKMGGEMARALGKVGVGISPFPWLRVSFDAKAFEGKYDLATKETSLAAVKLSVALQGTPPESIVKQYFDPNIVKGFNLVLEGKYEYSIPPEDLAKLAQLRRFQGKVTKHTGKMVAKVNEAAKLRGRNEQIQRALKKIEERKRKLKGIIKAQRPIGKQIRALAGQKKKQAAALAKKAKLDKLLKALPKDLKNLTPEARELLKKHGINTRNKKRALRKLRGLRSTLQGQLKSAAAIVKDGAKEAIAKQLHNLRAEEKAAKALIGSKDKLAKEAAENLKKIGKLEKGIAKHKAIIAKASQKAAAAAKVLKSKAGRLVAKAMEKQAVKATTKALGKLATKAIPGLNIIMAAVDIAELGVGIFNLATGRATIKFGGGGGFKIGDKGGKATGGDPTGHKLKDGEKPPVPGAGSDKGTSKTGGKGKGKDGDGKGKGGKDNKGGGGKGKGGKGGTGKTGATGKGPDAGKGGSKTGGLKGTGKGTGKGGGHGSAGLYDEVKDDDKAPPKLNPRVKLILNALKGKKGARFSNEHYRTLNEVVPKDLPMDQLKKVLKQITVDDARSADAVIGRIMQLVEAVKKGRNVTGGDKDPNAQDKQQPDLSRSNAKIDYKKAARLNRKWQRRLGWSTTVSGKDLPVGGKEWANWVYAHQVKNGLYKDGVCGAETTESAYRHAGMENTDAYRKALEYLKKRPNYEGPKGRAPISEGKGNKGRSGSGSTKGDGKGPSRLLHYQPPSLVKKGKDGRYAVDPAKIKHYTGKVFTHPDGLKCRMDKIDVSVESLANQGSSTPLQSVKFTIHASVAQLPKNPPAGYRWKVGDKRTEVFHFWYDPKTKKAGPIRQTNSIAEALGGLTEVKGNKLKLKSSDRGKSRELGAMKAKVMSLTSRAGRDNGDGKKAYDVRATIIPTEIRAHSTGIVVGGKHIPFRKGRRMTLPWMTIIK